MDLGIVYNPRPWQHAFTLAGGMAGLWLGNHAQSWADWLGCLWCFGVSGVYAAGLEFRMAQEAAKSRIVFEEAYKTPGAEQIGLMANKVRQWFEENRVVVTDGNIKTLVPEAQNVARTAPKQQLHPEMVAHQFVTTMPALNEYRVRHSLMRICKRQFTFRDHLGKPDGDYRETTWLSEFTRRELKVCLGILEFSGGIVRKGSARNSPYVTRDWEVVNMGRLGTPLPHPNGCECDDCAVK